MQKGGVIFDFNGTLFWDSEYQEKSWDEYLAAHHIFLTEQQKRDYIHGRNGKDTLEILFKRPFSDEEVHQYSEEKEVLYRNECLKHKMELAPGALALLDYLRGNDIPMAIATASGKSNVDFFIDQFNLLDYFAEEHIVYNDGTVKGKPHPDLFDRAIERLGVGKAGSVIFEDSHSGVQAALNCQVGHVVIVNSTDSDYADFDLPIITHFDGFDRRLLKN
ncbi:HAD family hydrolase [Flagellimonas sediminis]|uniref:HAD-IA family hydrolase n=1 Tax=Flagellimonas sediminis TaxID=2696468 RepID=A0A6I5KTR4_9FLAO|nr:HAD family phosphatase [Allomuricauda sediminis]NDV43395.1 HAD-IA family hydrolase [Allomuricauda sediminis]